MALEPTYADWHLRQFLSPWFQTGKSIDYAPQERRRTREVLQEPSAWIEEPTTQRIFAW
jgi:hypothetical protein